jgi:hypothetical protein
MAQENNTETICYADLSERAQRGIDRYPPEQAFTFFARRHGMGYSIHAVQERQLDLLEAQGGMGPGWMRVVFDCDAQEVDTEDIGVVDIWQKSVNMLC